MKPGDRIRLVHTSDKHTDLRPGDEGNVTFVDDRGTVHARWDNGSTLGLVPGEDRWDVQPPGTYPACSGCGNEPYHDEDGRWVGHEPDCPRPGTGPDMYAPVV
jgi:hypothetical protein